MSLRQARGRGRSVTVLALLILVAGASGFQFWNEREKKLASLDAGVAEHAERMLREGRQTFRFDTFGSEAFWGGQLRLHEAIAGAAQGGVGPGLSPNMAVSLGLKIDVDALPANLVQAVQNGRADLNDPNVTLTLLRLDAVIGLKGLFSGDRLTSVGIQCALCHSRVDESFRTPMIPAGVIGKRLDGWPARDLNVGAIAALSPTVKPFGDLLGVDEGTVRRVFNSWGRESSTRN
jgi:hypothetical protein